MGLSMAIKKRRVVVLLAACALMLLFAARWANSCAKPPQAPGVRDGRLADCPDRPNCVSTQAQNAEHRIEPLRLKQPVGDAMDRLKSIIKSMPRSRIISSGDGYLRVEFHSLVLRFVDDVEFVIDEPEQLIHFRSAARVGHSDLGVNRRRMEEIRRRYEAAD